MARSHTVQRAAPGPPKLHPEPHHRRPSFRSVVFLNPHARQARALSAAERGAVCA